MPEATSELLFCFFFSFRPFLTLRLPPLPLNFQKKYKFLRAQRPQFFSREQMGARGWPLRSLEGLRILERKPHKNQVQVPFFSMFPFFFPPLLNRPPRKPSFLGPSRIHRNLTVRPSFPSSVIVVVFGHCVLNDFSRHPPLTICPSSRSKFPWASKLLNSNRTS